MVTVLRGGTLRDTGQEGPTLMGRQAGAAVEEWAPLLPSLAFHQQELTVAGPLLLDSQPSQL